MSKIGILIDALHFGGVEKIAIRQVDALNKIGQEAELVILKRTDITDHPFSTSFQNVPLVFLDDRLPRLLKLNFKFPFFSFFSLYHLSYPLLLPWVIKKEEYRVIISHGTYTTFTAFTLKLIKKIPFFVLIWDPMEYILKKAYPRGVIRQLNFILLPLARLLDRLIISRAALIIVGGKSHIPYLKSLGAKKIKIIYPGVDAAPIFPSRRKNYILAVTSWNSGKRPEYNLEILEKLPQVSMTMAGNWHPRALQAQFKKLIKNKNLEERVKVTGPIEEKELKQFYSEARVFLQTNDDRGFGMPALEAAAHGCPFVIPMGQGVGELFKDGEDGFFTRERDTKTIISKIQLLLKDPREAERMGESGWQKVVNNYTWQKHAQKLATYLSRY